MKKNTLRAFTLVEMLIVIVIIGILIAALMPRMSAAQGRARDVARKTDLSQVQTAAISYYGDHGEFPAAANWSKLDEVFAPVVKEMGMVAAPKDPQEGSRIRGISANSNGVPSDEDIGHYRVKVVNRNGVENAGLFLVSHVEVLGSANAVVCDNSDGFYIIGDTNEFTPCATISEGPAGSCNYVAGGACKYDSEDELIYVAAY